MSTTMVWPALLPPAKRAHTSISEHRMSTSSAESKGADRYPGQESGKQLGLEMQDALPLPSSPHWLPSTTRSLFSVLSSWAAMAFTTRPQLDPVQTPVDPSKSASTRGAGVSDRSKVPMKTASSLKNAKSCDRPFGRKLRPDGCSLLELASKRASRRLPEWFAYKKGRPQDVILLLVHIFEFSSS